MNEFDTDTGRCYDCDGKWRHFSGCPFYVGEPALTLEQRVAARTDWR